MKFSSFALFVAVIAVGFFTLVYQHELAHQAIYENNGIKAEIDMWSEFPDRAMTIAESPCPTRECTLAHDINEVIGYTMIAFYIGIASLILAFRISLMDRR